MFLWIKLLAGVTDADQIFELLKDARVVVVPGAVVGSPLLDADLAAWRLSRLWAAQLCATYAKYGKSLRFPAGDMQNFPLMCMIMQPGNVQL